MDEKFLNQIDFQPFLSQFFQNASDLFAFVKDKDFKFRMVNNCLLNRLGFLSESEMIGKDDFDFFQTNLAELFRVEDSQVIDDKKSVLNATWSVPNGRGGLDWYISSKYPLMNRSGEVVGLIGVMRGITEVTSILEPYSQLSKVLRYIQENFEKQLEVSELAEMVNLSISQFERRFKKLLNMTPIKFINKVRVDNACEMLLKTNNTLSAIAYDCGFYDHSYFTKQFKKKMGKTPNDYRSEYLK
ncbi:MAG: AraC family transcriptional regulator [Lentisphaeraceae bacterium]|nr:AraC family transcriptional regulator [Lentisphaeraceae bacterium]